MYQPFISCMYCPILINDEIRLTVHPRPVLALPPHPPILKPTFSGYTIPTLKSREELMHLVVLLLLMVVEVVYGWRARRRDER